MDLCRSREVVRFAVRLALFSALGSGLACDALTLNDPGELDSGVQSSAGDGDGTDESHDSGADHPVVDAGAGAKDAGEGDAAPQDLPCGGCSADTPLCVADAAGGPGECKKLEILAFHTPGLEDLAHVSFATGANEWFPSMADAHGFTYEATSDWGRLRDLTVSPGRIVFFLDNAPGDGGEREAFEAYMENGGAWMGFHVSAWNDNPSGWSWYYQNFLACEGYWKNTWRPTSAVLRVESEHILVSGLGPTFETAPNEWYAFHGDLANNPAIEILLSIDPTSFPLGTNGNETWMSGYYPVVWRNKNYRMVYANMGHDDMDYGGTNQSLSSTFSSEKENQFFLNAIQWLGGVTEALDAP
jgi:hypothetical protein